MKGFLTGIFLHLKTQRVYFWYYSQFSAQQYGLKVTDRHSESPKCCLIKSKLISEEFKLCLISVMTENSLWIWIHLLSFSRNPLQNYLKHISLAWSSIYFLFYSSVQLDWWMNLLLSVHIWLKELKKILVVGHWMVPVICPHKPKSFSSEHVRLAYRLMSWW